MEARDLPGSGFITSRLAALATELEDRAEAEKCELRSRISQVEVEKMQQQLACLRMEAQLNEANTRLCESQDALQKANAECESLRRSATDSAATPTPAAEREASQQQRINELSRELIATRFELAEQASAARAASAPRTPLKRSPSQPQPLRSPTRTAPASSSPPHKGTPPPAVAEQVSSLSVSTLLQAAHALDLQRADAILNPTCVRSRALGYDAWDSAGKTAAAGAPRACSLAEQLGQALHAACRPISAAPARRAAAPAPPSSPTSGGRKATGRAGSASGRHGASASPAPGVSPTATSSSCSSSPSSASASPPVEGGDPPSPVMVVGAGSVAGLGSALPRGTDAGDAACAILEALLLRGASLETADPSDGGTPLHAAADSGRTAPVTLLLEHGAAIDATDSLGRTPLHRAAALGAADVVALLMRHGASLELRDAQVGGTPPHRHTHTHTHTRPL